MKATLVCSGCGEPLTEHVCPNQPMEINLTLRSFVATQESAYVTAAIAKFSGDREKAADMLGISLATIYRKVPGRPD